MKKLLLLCAVFTLNIYGADPRTIRSDPRLAKSVPSTGDIDKLLVKGEQFEVKPVDGRLTLNLAGKKLQNIGGMANIPGIETVQVLNLAVNELVSLEGLPEELPVLRGLDLHNNQLESLQGLPEELPALRGLVLFDNPLSDEAKQEIKAKYPFVDF
ncbi:MAG: leucine-rich repeat domain-containing protein [Candidatus Dependentiae bacterium]